MRDIPSIKKAESLDRPLEAAKWLQFPMMLSVEELEDLSAKLGPFHIVKTLAKADIGKAIIPLEDFLALYKEYADTLMKGELPDPKRYKGPFSSVITQDLDALYSMPMDDPNFEVIKVKKPIIQMQYHTMTWSKEEGKFRSQLFGKDQFPWGLLFSYPQIILDPDTKEIVKADAEGFVNSRLFKTIQSWQREMTIPTPFLVAGKRINAPQRIGKKCLQWIGNHPSLKALDISIGVKNAR